MTAGDSADTKTLSLKFYLNEGLIIDIKEFSRINYRVCVRESFWKYFEITLLKYHFKMLTDYPEKSRKGILMPSDSIGMVNSGRPIR